MATQKIYTVKRDGVDEEPRLVRAPNQAQALRHVARDFAVSLASQDELVKLLGAGVAVEDAGAEAT